MEWWDQLTDVSFAGNPLWRFVMLFVSLALGFAAGKVVGAVLSAYRKRLEGKDRPVFASLCGGLGKSLGLLGFVLGLDVGLEWLEMTALARGIADTVTAVLMVAAMTVIAFRMVDAPAAWLYARAERSENNLDKMLAPVLRTSLRTTVVVLAGVQVAHVLSNKPITSIIAGLGIGGLALALAAQDSLKNFFGSVVILLDKPFRIGDRVVVDGQDGPIEEVGWRSTRLRTLEGHLVTIPNGELANKSIRNIGERPHIRRLANITITYDTPLEKIEKAVDIIKDILKNHEGMDPDFPPRVYFSDFNDASLNIMMLYWYHPPDYWAYMDFSERVNLEIFRRFEKEGIEFAFPTQTLYVAGDPNRPLNVGIHDERQDSA